MTNQNSSSVLRLCENTGKTLEMSLNMGHLGRKLGGQREESPEESRLAWVGLGEGR